ncbi:hypothetical protein I6F20_30965 [Bradyrhizobium sp. IC3123]|uniref:hypothetical protein n=1 Tax=Bradyrhizobium sp. IC3123 TaxID=2793803 RepID=UPI001CD5D4A2|nr:hypothetical protein [Bradyrhizobium sp. IC3123]MCA1393459.1 hypothetical protein [Bradyrhizobium sp. IC3123]
MTNLPEFESPKDLVGHAQEHIDRLDGEIKAFFGRNPYAHVIDFDRETRQQVYKFRLTAKLPSKVRLVFKDVTSNLRDALDHAVYASAVALGINSPKKTGFPFGNDAFHLASELGTWKFSDVPRELHPVLMSFQPYPGGNNLIIDLNRMRNPNTHRVIIPIGNASLASEISNAGGKIVTPAQLGYCKWDASKDEVEYMRLGIGSEFKHEAKVAFDVTFADPNIMEGQPVVPALRAIHAEVDRIVLGIEAETARILRERNG